MFLPIIPLKAITVLGLEESRWGAISLRLHGSSASPPSRIRSLSGTASSAVISTASSGAVSRRSPSSSTLSGNAGSADYGGLAEAAVSRAFGRCVAASQSGRRREVRRDHGLVSRAGANQPEPPAWYEKSFFRRYAAPK